MRYSASRISLVDVAVGYQQHEVLRGISLDFPARGIVGLLGPSGVGKSTLLRTIARWNEALPSFWLLGDIRIGGKSLLNDFSVDAAHDLVPLLVQKATLYTATVADNAIDGVRDERTLSAAAKRSLAESVLAPLELWPLFADRLDEPVLSLSIGEQRVLSVARLISGGAMALLVDEPFRDIDPIDAVILSRVLKHFARDHLVIMTTHNQQVARDHCDFVHLVVGGAVIESASAQDFFAQPKSKLAQDFVRTGSCWFDSEQNGGRRDREALSPSLPLPGGFHWALVGSLGGMQRPGLLGDEREAILALLQLGCTKLVTLTEAPYSHELLAGTTIETHHFPIPDMQVPSLAAAASWTQRISAWIDDGEVCVLHCKAGLGRTGTLLACVLVHRGLSPVRAVDTVRSINPHYIQSTVQLEFISSFFDYQRNPVATRATAES